MRARLYWLDGRVEELKGEIDPETKAIVRPGQDGQHRFSAVEEIDDEGFAIFWEDEGDDAPVH